MTEYHSIKIGEIEIGGPLGVNTGLAVGSIFYDKHSIVSDAFAGNFNIDKAKLLIDRVNTLSHRYGINMGVDVIAASVEAMEKFLIFVSEHTTLPLLINSTDAEVRLAGLETASNLGILDRCIYASINEDTEDDEIELLGRNRPASVMILASDIGNPTPEGSCEMIESFYHPILKDIGITAPIVDVGTMDPPSIGLNIRQISAVRDRFGYPAGCAFSNCFPQWIVLHKLGKEKVELSMAAALVACRAAGADFLHYGIIEKAEMAAHVSGTAEVFYGFAARELDGKKLSEGHALWKMFNLS